MSGWSAVAQGALGLTDTIANGLIQKEISDQNAKNIKNANSAGLNAQKATAMKRPAEFDTMFGDFMRQYFGFDMNTQNEIKALQNKLNYVKLFGPSALRGKLEKQIQELQAKMQANAGPGYKEALNLAYGERGEADKQYIDAVSKAMQPHSGLLSEIINKQMAGETVGPYGADINKLLGERTGISFGGGDPMQFITGSQQRLLSDLLQSQLLGLGQIKDFSKERAMADLEPAQKAFDLFRPSNSSELAYMQDLRSLIEPMEYARMGATPSVSGFSSQNVPQIQPQQSATGLISQGIGNMSSLMSLADQIGQMFEDDTPPPSTTIESSSTGSSPVVIRT